ncbi:Lysyl hydrolase/glycosyltransferase family 25 [Phaffia rhodozyma]|uniref:Lysyl hydrolase/glycosyltransferase family 25 n=1 Tax=Phaffia rhodozyma TaxID=264483 RepID=A0A0F7SRU6_PHARH|nr:Lysyl hydrolase/glycosyltransferase family 25 [Phaffia rhodozyma]
MFIRSLPSAVYLILVWPAVIICATFFIGLFTPGIHSFLLLEKAQGPSGSWEGARSLFRRDVQQRTDPALEASEFDKIIVINLARRQDRRDHMKLLARAQDMEFEFFKATSFTDPEVIWIEERLWEDQNGIVWDGPVDPDGHSVSWREFYRQRLARSGSEEEEEDEEEDEEKEKKEGGSRQEMFKSIYASRSILGTQFPLINSGVTSLPGPLACWTSHLAVLRSIVDRGLNRTLILEDDVDLAWDFRRSWSSIFRALPKDPSPDGNGDWEMVYLGYSFSDETANRPVHHPYVRPSEHPLGTFGYSLSQTGARRILEFLQRDAQLFTKPVDWAFADYIPESRRNGRGAGLGGTGEGAGGVFSLLPPLVGHGRYEFGTDIGGASNAWKTWLADSTMDRLEAYQRSIQTEHQELDS